MNLLSLQKISGHMLLAFCTCFVIQCMEEGSTTNAQSQAQVQPKVSAPGEIEKNPVALSGNSQTSAVVESDDAKRRRAFLMRAMFGPSHMPFGRNIEGSRS